MLVLEDDADALVFLVRLLSAIPVDAVPVPTCAAARRVASSIGAFDVLITDVELPDGDGLALAAELRRLHGCAVVVMSGFDPPPGEPLPDGVELWILKPVDARALRAAVVALTGA